MCMPGMRYVTMNTSANASLFPEFLMSRESGSMTYNNVKDLQWGLGKSAS